MGFAPIVLFQRCSSFWKEKKMLIQRKVDNNKLKIKNKKSKQKGHVRLHLVFIKPNSS
jgi:hypothetical protein